MRRQEILLNVFTQLRNAGFVCNKGDFAKKLKYNISYVSSAFSGSRPGNLSDKFFQRILATFSAINESYLKTGCGEVLRGTAYEGYATGILPFATIPGVPQNILEGLRAEQEVLHRRLNQIDRILSQLTASMHANCLEV